MLCIYKAPNGFTYQYEEGTQPEGYVLVDPKPAKRPATRKRRATTDKAAKADNK